MFQFNDYTIRLTFAVYDVMRNETDEQIPFIHRVGMRSRKLMLDFMSASSRRCDGLCESQCQSACVIFSSVYLIYTIYISTIPQNSKCLIIMHACHYYHKINILNGKSLKR